MVVRRRRFGQIGKGSWGTFELGVRLPIGSWAEMLVGWRLAWVVGGWAMAARRGLAEVGLRAREGGVGG